MTDQISRSDEESEMRARKKIKFACELEGAAEFYQQAANSFKLAKSWEQAATAYSKLADCHLMMDGKQDAASSYVDAANCSKKIISPKQTISYLEKAIELFAGLGRFSTAARCCKEVGELYDRERNLEQAIAHLERASELFLVEQVLTPAIQCRLKVAQLSALQKQYAKAGAMFEDMARQCYDDNMLRYAVRGHLLNAGICHLCNDVNAAAITNALERYQDMDPSFSRSREYQLLADLAGAIEEESVGEFTDILKEYDSLTPLDAWKTSMLLRVKEALKTKK